jgi:hypothetical protein
MDAEKFYARTYITEGMRLLLISVVPRLIGKPSVPVLHSLGRGGGSANAPCGKARHVR